MNHLLKLLAANKGLPRRAEIVRNAATNEATIYLYDAIVSDELTAEWCGGVSAQGFVKEVAALDPQATIHLRVNSPGGDVFAARAMEQALRNHKGQVIAYIDGYAASAASYLALAADQVEIAPGGFFMIHKAWTMAYGNADDLTATAALLDKVDESLVATYAAETGQPADQLREWMKAETWLNAEEAVKYGFADRVAAGAVKDVTSWDLSAYARAPKAEAHPNNDGKRQVTVSIPSDGLDASAALTAINDAIAAERRPTVAPLNMAEQEFLTAMIAHHGTAIEMARGLVKADPQAPLRDFCEDVIEDAAGEVELMKLWLEVGVEEPAPAGGGANASATRNTDDLLRSLRVAELTA